MNYVLENHKNKMDINACDLQGFTALMRAAQSGYIRLVQLLIQYKADISVQNQNTEKTALDYAIDANQLKSVKSCRVSTKITIVTEYYFRIKSSKN